MWHTTYVRIHLESPSPGKQSLDNVAILQNFQVGTSKLNRAIEMQLKCTQYQKFRFHDEQTDFQCVRKGLKDLGIS